MFYVCMMQIEYITSIRNELIYKMDKLFIKSDEEYQAVVSKVEELMEVNSHLLREITRERNAKEELRKAY